MRKRIPQPEPDRAATLKRRAIRYLKHGEARKAALALRELTALQPTGPSHVRLAHALLLAGKRDEALLALKQALFLFRHEEMRGRARTVARLILRLDPTDSSALRRAA